MFTDAGFRDALLAAGALGVTCAVLSVFVVSRRWAFIGEGISHSGFGGAGTVWMIALLAPGLDRDWMPYVGVVVFCLATALAIGWVSRGGKVNSDAAIGIFLVGSLAWGFLGQQLYVEYRQVAPAGFYNILFGEHALVSRQYMIAAVMVCSAVLLTVLMLNKEIVSYCFDPVMAQVQGVRAGLIHYLMMLLLGLVIIIGVRIAGSVLVTALLILPGTTAMLLGERLRPVLVVSILVGMLGAVGGLLVNLNWRFLPAGPAIVLILFAQFLLAYGWVRVRGAA